MSVMRDYYIWLKDNGRTDSPESQQAYMAIQNSAPSSPWHLDGKGIIDGGDVGGDIQVGTAWSVRYIRDDMPGSLIIETVYVVKTPSGRGHGYAYETRSTYLVCTDPADPEGTKVWSHTEKEGSLCDYPTAKEASDDAWQVVLRINTDAQAGAHDGWDGTPGD